MHIKKQIFMIWLAVILLLALVAVWPVLAGNIGSPDAPGSTSSYTLQDIYDRLTNGEAGTQSAFTQPIFAPESTMVDLNTIMAAAPVLDAANGAVAADVAPGKTFWGLTSGQWGGQTGTGPLAQFIVPPPVVPATGQTGCWAENGDEINPCTGTGQDGEYQLGITPAVAPTCCGTANAYNTPAWTGTRFTDNGDGTVTDNLTALVWLQDANCIANHYPSFDTDFTANDGRVTWQHGLDFVAGINSGTYSNCGGGQTDWRLPNINELHSLIDLTVSDPALPSGHPFSAVQSFYYWSSTSFAFSTSLAWLVNLDSGYVLSANKSGDGYVWPVRAGQ